MDSKNSLFVKGAFKQYYFKHAGSIEVPSRIAEREFGYMSIQGTGMVRHLSYKTVGTLLATLVKEVPLDVYCSNAYYRFPTYPMQEKQWLGADLIFDIDGKDLELPCEPTHTFAKCVHCGHIVEPNEDNHASFKCENCQQTKLDKISVPCKDCVRGSKEELKKLTRLLMNDFGIKDAEISIYFSGNNGFHIHINNEAFMNLEREARLDIVSYISGIGLMTESLGVRRRQGDGDDFFVKFPRGGISYGWRKRMADELKVEISSVERLSNIVRKKGGYHAFKTEFEASAKGMGARIDPQVTTDVHRVFRMPETLNSKSGLAKSKVSDIESFNPFLEACLLGDEEATVDAKVQLRLSLKGKSFRIKKGENVIPSFAAIYLVCKGLADVA